MTIRWLLAALHLFAMALGFAGISERARALRAPLDGPGLRRVFAADNAWGISALLLIPTGLVRAFAGVEKGTAYYLDNRMFWVKMALLALVLALEILPIMTMIRWRVAVGRRLAVDTSRAPLLALVSRIQAVLLVLLVLAATAMARGIGY